MSRNGSGTYTLPASNPVVTGTTISSTWANNTLSDIATALTNSIAKDGQTTPTANLPMGGFKFTGLGTGSAATDSANLTQIQAQAYIYLGSVSGTDTITATTNPVTSSYVAGQTYRFVASGSNTGAATININSLGAKAITKIGTNALTAGDIAINSVYQITYDGTQFQLLNPGVNITADSVTSASLADSALGFAMVNGTLTASVSSNALTVAIKTKGGTDPTSADPVLIVFRSGTLTSGVYNVRSVVAATSVVISSGSTLGATNAVQSSLDVIALDNAGTVELGIINNLGAVVLSEIGVISTTAEGGAGAADSSGVVYSTTARSNVAYRCVGKVISTQATAGTWATSPSNVSISPARYVSEDDIRPALNATGYAPMYVCRAWVQFNGTGTPAIRGSGNITSLTDNGVGDFTLNFTTAMPDANYAVIVTSGDTAAGFIGAARFNTTAPTTSAARIGTFTTAGAAADLTYASAIVLR